MASPLDRIRSFTGVGSSQAIPDPGSPPLVGQATLDDALAARRGAPTDLSGLKTPAVVAGALAMLSVFLYSPVTSWTAMNADNNDLFVYHWIDRIVTVASVNVWGPWVAGFGAAAIIIAAIWTNGISDGEAPSIATLTIGGLASVVPATPLAIAMVIGVVAIVIYIVLMILLVAAIIAFIGALLMGSGS